MTDRLLHVIASTLRDVPELNGTFQDAPQLADDIHLGLAVATERGVVIPVIHHADRLDIDAIGVERRRLSAAARAGDLLAADLLGGTATLSNLGGYPVDLFTPVIFGPQICLVATGRIRAQPVLHDDALANEHRIWVNVCIDHRAADGEAGGRFLEALQQRMEHLAT